MFDEVDALAGSEIKRLYVLLADDAWWLDVAHRRLSDALRPRCEPASFNLTRFRCGDGPADAAVASARTLPMMSELRIVELLEAQSADDGTLAALATYLDAPSGSTAVVVAGTGLGGRSKAAQQAAKQILSAAKGCGGLLDHRKRRISMPAFIRHRAEENGATFAPEAAALLVELVGQDLARLSTEVDKLSLAVEPGQTIDEATVLRVAAATASVDAFAVTQAVASRDPAAALTALQRALDDGDAPHALLSRIAWQVRTSLQAAEAMRRGASDADVRRTVKVGRMDLRRLRVALKAGTFPPAAELLGALADANLDMHGARAGERRVIERLVLRLCGVPT